MNNQASPQPQHLYEMLYNMLSTTFAGTGMRLSILQEDGYTYKRTGTFSEYCSLVRDNPEEIQSCLACTLRGVHRVRELKKPFFYRCHKGLVVTIVPVLQGRQIMAYIVFSGYLLKGEIMDRLPIFRMDRNDPLLQSLLSQAEGSIPSYTKERIDEIIQLLTMTAGYVAEMANHTRLLEELQDKSLELLTAANLQEQKERKAYHQKLRELERRVWDVFSYDALEQICIIARDEGAYRTEQLLHYLAQRNRKGTTPGILTTLGREVEEIGGHIALLQGLYQGQLEITMEVKPGYDPELEVIQIPFGTVVDLIIHGPLSSVEQGGHLFFSLAQEKDFLVLIFLDNGYRALPENVEREHQLRPMDQMGDDDYAIFMSMIEETKRRFGPKFQWSFSANTGQDNRLTLYLPYGEAVQT